MLHFCVIYLRSYDTSRDVSTKLLNMTLEEFIVDYFGTKELAARRLKVSRFTIYRWMAQPDIIQLKHFHKLAQITETDVHTIIDLCTPCTGRANDARARKVTNSNNANNTLLARGAS
jgi:hypothetical protein